jgi:hypothetical protein
MDFFNTHRRFRSLTLNERKGDFATMILDETPEALETIVPRYVQ